MKKYRVKVNGKLYEVELEAVEEVAGSIQKEVPTKAATSTSGTVVLAPIGGKVVDVKVKEGQLVHKGDVLCIIEAMKMENDVLATTDGVIKEMKTNKGAVVANKDPLFIID